MKAPRCPICQTPIRPDAEARWKPFCSERCKLLDLSRWLEGDYVIPGPPADAPPPDPDE